MGKKPLFAALVLLIVLVLAGSARGAGGSAVGWGDNSYGQLTGPESSASPAVPAIGLSEAAQIVAGGYHSLAVITDGTVRAWGVNYEGELGIGNDTGPETCSSIYTCSTKVLTVPGLSGAVAVAAGGGQSLALLANGMVMAWGENSSGQLGIGNSSGPEICHLKPCSTKPLLVPGLSNVVAIAAGDGQSLALLADGTVMVWGVADEGQDGSGEAASNSCKCLDHPVRVPGVSNAVAIAAGENGGSALLDDGTVMNWGENFYGELGNGIVTEGMICNCLGRSRSPVSRAPGQSASATTTVWRRWERAAPGVGAKTTPASSAPVRRRKPAVSASLRRRLSAGSPPHRRSKPTTLSALRCSPTAPSGPGVTALKASSETVGRPPNARARHPCPASPGPAKSPPAKTTALR